MEYISGQSVPAVGKSKPPKAIPSTLLILPLEIRFRIYDAILNTHHLIIISPRGTQRGILKPVVLICHQVRVEIQKWLEGKTDSTIIRSPTFGVFDDSLTTFKMSWLNNGFLPGSICTGDNARYQRCYTPNHSACVLELLEMWQRAMDFTGSDKRSMVNLAVIKLEKFERYKILKDLWKLLNCDSGDDWKVLHESWFEREEKPVRKQIVFSRDYDTHAVHQSYFRQHPGEKERVRKVECGLAFEFRFVGEEMDFVEVE